MLSGVSRSDTGWEVFVLEQSWCTNDLNHKAPMQASRQFPLARQPPKDTLDYSRERKETMRGALSTAIQ